MSDRMLRSNRPTMAQLSPPITTRASHSGSNRLMTSIACLLVAHNRGIVTYDTKYPAVCGRLLVRQTIFLLVRSGVVGRRLRQTLAHVLPPRILGVVWLTLFAHERVLPHRRIHDQYVDHVGGRLTVALRAKRGDGWRAARSAARVTKSPTAGVNVTG